MPVDVSVILTTREYPIAQELYHLHNLGENTRECCSIAMLLLMYNETFAPLENSPFTAIFEPFLDQIYTRILTLFNQEWHLNYRDQEADYLLKRNCQEF